MTDNVVPMIRYVSERYATVTSLDEVARRYMMSPSTASRRFKEVTGKTFSEYVSGLRLEYAAHDLVSDDDEIADIARRNGFSSPSVFSRVFRHAYGMSPRDYRTRYKVDRHRQVTHRIRVNHDGRTVDSRIEFGVSLGPIANMSLPSFLDNVLDIVGTLPVSRIRIDNVLSDFIFQRNHPYILQGKEYEGFQPAYVDGIFDRLTALGLPITLEMTDRGWSISQSPDKNLVATDKAVSSLMPRQIVTATVSLLRYWSDRYQARNLHDWHLDIFYDPASMQIRSYVDLLRNVTAMAHDILPDCKVGGCGLSPIDDRQAFTTFAQTLRDMAFTPDYVDIQSHACSLMVATGDGTPEADGYRLRNEILTARRTLDAYGVTSPVQVGMWNPVQSQRNCYNDSSEKGTMVIRELAGCLDLPVCVTYASLNDINSVYSDVETLFFGGNGLTAKDGFAKPAYHAFRFCEDLPAHIIARGDGYVAGRDDDGTCTLLLWNGTGLNRRYTQAEEYELTQSQLRLYYQQEHDTTYTVELSNMPRNRYLLREYQVDDEAGNAVAAADRYCVDGRLPKEDHRFIAAAALPRFTTRKVVQTDGAVRFTVHLKPHGFALVRLTELH